MKPTILLSTLVVISLCLQSSLALSYNAPKEVRLPIAEKCYDEQLDSYCSKEFFEKTCRKNFKENKSLMIDSYFYVPREFTSNDCLWRPPYSKVFCAVIENWIKCRSYYEYIYDEEQKRIENNKNK